MTLLPTMHPKERGTRTQFGVRVPQFSRALTQNVSGLFANRKPLLRERSDERWNFHLKNLCLQHFLHHLHFLCIFLCTRYTSLLRKNGLRDSIFHRTVLEVYWEFGARIGTKMKLSVSTFSSFRLFLVSKTTTLLNF